MFGSRKSKNVKAATNPVDYYSQLLDEQYINKIQGDIVNVINNSKIINSYDPFTIAIGIAALLENTYIHLVRDAAGSDAEIQEIADKVTSIRKYLENALNTRHESQLGSRTGEDAPSHEVLAIIGLLRQAMAIMISSTREYVRNK